MTSMQHEEAAGGPLLSPPTTAGSNPGPGAGKSFSGGAESQARNARPPPAHGRKRQNITEARASRYRGVQWDRNGGRWRARIHTDRTRHIGYFESEDEAAMAWDMAVLRYFGEAEGKKKLNFGEASIARYRQEPNAQPQAINPRFSGSRSGGAEEVSAVSYRGVVPHDGGTFRAMIMKNRLNVTVGVFATPEEAARAHDCAALEAHGWGTLTNFPLSDYETDSNGKPAISAAKRQQLGLPPLGPQDQSQQHLQSHHHQSQQHHMPTTAGGSLGMLRRQTSLPNGFTSRDANTLAAQRLLRSSSHTSVELSTLLHGQRQAVPGTTAAAGTAGPTNLHHLAAAAQHAGWHTHAGLAFMTPPPPPSFTIHHHPQGPAATIATHMNGATAITSPQALDTLMANNLINTAAVMQQRQGNNTTNPEITTRPLENNNNNTGGSDHQRKRPRSDDNSSGNPSRGSDGTTGGNKSNTATGTGTADGSGGGPPGVTQGRCHHTTHQKRSPSSSPPPVETTTAAVAGVRQLHDGSYQAALYIDLGTFGSYDDAVRAYDRAALMTTGFSTPTHFPLTEAVMRSATASGGGPPQLVPAAMSNGVSSRFRGVTLRAGSFLATLDIGGKAYELGPFATEMDAAKAYDKYAMMLRGVAAQTNFPPWDHMASPAEVAALVEAVGVVALNAGERQLSGGNVVVGGGGGNCGGGGMMQGIQSSHQG